MKPKFVIIGAGPTGLGAAYRLKELGYDNFAVYERIAANRRPRQQFHGFRRLYLGHRRPRDVQPLQILRRRVR